MIKTFFKIIAILLLVIFQIAFLTKLNFLGVVPNLILVLAISLIIKGFFQEGILVAGIGGLSLDLTSTLRFGLYSFLFLVIILILYWFVLKILPAPGIFFLFLIFFGSFLFLEAMIFVLLMRLPPLIIFPQAAISGLWGILIWEVLRPMIKTPEEIKIT